MKDQYKSVAKWYDKIIEPLLSGLKAIGLKMHHVNENTTVLDIGCGTGTLLSLYQKYTSKIFGIDLSSSMIKVARKKLGMETNLIIGSATKMEFKEHQFDLITCSFILHEVPQIVRMEILKEAKRALQNDGRILLIDYHPGPIKKLKGIYSKLIITFFEFLAGGDHYRNYRQFIKNGGLPSLIEKLGLKIENQKIVSGGNFGIFILSK
jgi:ubiquinone/menaquinone biosynthesis C-methylase UbiE